MAGIELFANQAHTTVSSGGTTAPSSGTSETWTVSSSSGFPAASSTAHPPTFFRVEDLALSSEVIVVTNVSGTTWTVTRGAEGTAPVAHSTGFTVKNVITAAALEGLFQSTAVQYVFPSGDTTGATDATNILGAISALPSGDGGVVRLMPAGDWNISGGQVTAATGTYIDGSGCWINARGAGDIFRWADSSTYGGRDLRGGGLLGFPVVDGTHTTGNSAAVHAGDILQLSMYAQAQNFTAGTTSKGFWFDNQSYWTEQLKGRVFTQNCTQAVTFDVSGTPLTTATGSFDRTDLDVYIAQGATANTGVTFQSGTYIVNGPGLRIYGNFNGAASAPSTAVLTLTGSAGGSRPDTGQYSRLVNCGLSIGTECNTTTGNTNGPQTIRFGAAGNVISGCWGSIDFSADGLFFQASNAVTAQFGYSGFVTGDSVLAAIVQTPTNPLWLTQLTTMVNSGNALVASTDGTATSGGAIVLSPQSDTHGFIGIYSTSLGGYAYMVPNIANAHWAPSFGGAGGKGFGILCSTASTGAVAFGVLNFNQTAFGLGNAEFTVYDNGTTVTLKNTLDDGNGNSITTGVASHSGGTNTSGTAAASTPTFTSGTAKQLSTTQDVMLYLAVKTSIAVTLSIGSTSAASTSIVPVTTMPIGAFVSVRIPKSWYVNLTCATMGDLQLTQVTC